MKKNILVFLVIGIAFIIVLRKTKTPSETPPFSVSTSQPSSATIDTVATTVPYSLEVVAQNLSVPWSMVFTSPTRMLVSERPGRIRVIENGSLLPTPLILFSEVSSNAEEGLMGLEKDPNYEQNHSLYAAVATQKKTLVVKIVRLIDEGQSARVDKILLDNIPAAQFHAGNRLKFGPDGKLYATTGDATNKQLAQQKTSLAGKILRLNPDGSIPVDNPFPNSYLFSLGHRNPQGIAWHPLSHELYATEHGPSLFDGPPGGDEVNHIVRGSNYGWPVVSHEKSKEGMVDPLVVYTPAVAPASALIYSGRMFPQFTNNLLFGGLKGEGVYRVILDKINPDVVLAQEKLSGIDVGRIRDVIEGPEGYIYFSTSNQDGRGRVRTGDDKIYRLVPQ